MYVTVSSHRGLPGISQLSLKGWVHPQMKIQSLSAHLHTDGKSREVSRSVKHFWNFTAKQHCSVFLNKWSRQWLVLRRKNLRSQLFFLFFYILKQVIIYFRCDCFTVTLQKCFVDDKTNFPSADNDWIAIFGCPHPLACMNLTITGWQPSLCVCSQELISSSFIICWS